MRRARYSIMVQERYSEREVELCRVDNDPEGLCEAARNKTFPGGMLKYSRVRIVDHGTPPPVATP